MQRSDLAARLGIPLASVDALLDERIGVDAKLAVRLGDVFALSAQYWQALQLQYDLWQSQILATQPSESGAEHATAATSRF